jgi:hypothetical protein
MFKGMPKAFWIGMLIMYGYLATFLTLEMTIPQFATKKFLGIAGCWTYNMFVGIFLLNVFLAWYFAYSEEQREKKLEERKMHKT